MYLKLLGVLLADMVAQVSARNRILFEASELQHDGRLNLALQDDRSTHLIQVLKMQPQDQVKVGIVNGPFGQATVLHTHPDVVLQCHLWQTPPTLGQLFLVLAMPRPKVMKRLWSTLACLGVTRVYITGAEKVEKVYFASHALKSDSFYPELIHGAEQAGDTRLPAVFFSKSLHATLAAIQSAVYNTKSSQQPPKPTLSPHQIAKMPGQSSSPSEQAQASKLLTSPRAMQAGPSRGVQCLFPESAASLSLPAMQHQKQDSSQASVSLKMHAAAAGPSNSNVPMEAIKLLAHTVGVLSVHQAVASHMAVHSSSSVQAAKDSSLDDASSASAGPGDHTGTGSQHSCDRLATADDKLPAAGGELTVDGQRQDTFFGQLIIDNERQYSAIGRPKTGPETQARPAVVLAIGPEGGWVDSEIALFTDQYDFQVVTVAGNRILDTTTAVISLVSLAVDALSM